MRKLKLQVQISIDGFVSTGPNDEQHWVTWQWDEIRPQVLAMCDAADTILLGRKLAVDYIPYWLEVCNHPEDELYELGPRIANMKKVIFTKTLEKAEWPNTVLAKGDLVEEVMKLKRQEGKDIAVYGGSSFVSALIKAGLVDEYNLYINPVAIGHGGAIFDGLNVFRKMKLTGSIVYQCGIVKLQYVPL